MATSDNSVHPIETMDANGCTKALVAFRLSLDRAERGMELLGYVDQMTRMDAVGYALARVRCNMTAVAGIKPESIAALLALEAAFGAMCRDLDAMTAARWDAAYRAHALEIELAAMKKAATP